MEFKFAVNDVFKQPIVKIGNNLLPPGFTGDRRAFWDVVGKVSEVVNAMGEASAAAQGLTKPITTAERLRNSEHSVYLLIDQNAGNGRGAVTGMLKTGMKGLYVFDRNGQHYQVSPPCVLDFYVHESRQRTGLGKRLFEHMLQTESIEPVKMAIDRPSEKFLGFLNKHYSLNNPVKQMNNYVVFDGFFPGAQDKNGTVESHSSHSNTPVGKKQSANGLQTSTYASPLGRYGAPRPPCSMGQIIHNQTSTIAKTPEPTGAQIASQ
ncbi:alpha-tubulin N-acetyltransferase isoform X5 [Tribolium castaneum]|uniref:alpha-tubulin N-acetyltransferase isoform X5 n=1 Tax=Tribolium castaneum TaxID=7070 RepID=UPI00046C00B1|nr:PREDICTED: alpha-tubulin N-acetyltransferase isoform X5 [Tribolium castaneum]|eukprot:XP_008190546.1 PREDICTED: alpha-tubulin N-acetyltransferase isoform X5 [Tribolium castaneum]